MTDNRGRRPRDRPFLHVDRVPASRNVPRPNHTSFRVFSPHPPDYYSLNNALPPNYRPPSPAPLYSLMADSPVPSWLAPEETRPFDARQSQQGERPPPGDPPGHSLPVSDGNVRNMYGVSSWRGRGLEDDESRATRRLRLEEEAEERMMVARERERQRMLAAREM